jgi:hypothetical protein
MYFPYLRGKQFELIALREICNFVSQKKLISPIIEPVKETTVSLDKTLDCLKTNKLNFNLIINPQVGGIKNSNDIMQIKDRIIGSYTNYQPALIINNKSDIKLLQTLVYRNNLKNLTIICDNIPKKEEDFFTFIVNNNIKYVIINETISSKRFLRKLIKEKINKITLTEPFKMLRRNVDYRENENEFFSDEHLFYEDEGFTGFSDYVTIGREYMESGFLPYAVVIHLTYLNSDKEFWIKHFVSDSDEDTTDVAGKFGEALKKLIEFINHKDIHTEACEDFRRLYNEEAYPGLGSIKKLSIKHHIELVYNFLKGID